ncbi:hypothetical protein M2459_002972 [Parabacteroides sp. PF5-5]|uniref:hypothetical protein n=1 Tax=unclassified Parabacteroides TaxID=2649774 RepID=UPI00247635D9|nr:MULTISPECIES: hypothetical protein [unclassified Parabacteroides]MDH6305961.1 hypothetical protein [Parabacteroides sp. PH5-39]MDH6317217.1 hypothetical protein [Parabacteroides sp. PF5-13]MDH6320673.1 hypothetical protein [Parabacteroides sp. PH5-13]MDH6324406.1 hypothetical protein [Parabacteroides sp. PH5-8]MDH6328402.1 hypothetical protein [Parabacteroides sp. PH5-41]
MKKLVKIQLYFVCFFLSTCTLYAANNLRMLDIRSMGMGGNGVTGSPLFNPALIAIPGESNIHLNYFNRYGLKELATINGGFHFPNDILSFGLDVLSFGYDAYRESMFRLSLGKQLSSRFSLGISIQYAMLQTELMEDRLGRLSTDVGISYSPFENLLIGMLIMDRPAVFIGDKSFEIKDFTAYLLQIGFRWEVINKLFISATLESNDEKAVTAEAGVEYIPFDQFSLRAGIRGNPLLPSFGIGYGFSLFRIDVAAVYHPVLGISSGVGLMFSF